MATRKKAAKPAPTKAKRTRAAGGKGLSMRMADKSVEALGTLFGEMGGEMRGVREPKKGSRITLPPSAAPKAKRKDAPKAKRKDAPRTGKKAARTKARGKTAKK